MPLWLGQEGLTSQTAYTATYVAANSFSISGVNLTSELVDTVRVKIYSGGEYKYSTVSSSSYSGGNTTVVLDESELTDPCGNFFYSPLGAGIVGNAPKHDHSDGDQCGDDVVGAPPDHEVSGVNVRFRKPDGSWGDWITAAGDGDGGGSGDAASDEAYFLFYAG